VETGFVNIAIFITLQVEKFVTVANCPKLMMLQSKLQNHSMLMTGSVQIASIKILIREIIAENVEI
jgi:hypothetical protein